MLAIVAALKDEISEYLSRGQYRVTVTDGRLRIYQSELLPDVVVSEGGVGRELSQKGTLQLVERFRPDMVISAGFAGGAMTGANTGEGFFCDRLVAVDGPLFLWEKSEAVEYLDHGLLDRIRANIPGGAAENQVCACLTVPQFISNSSMKAWLGSTFEVRLIDMESYWVAEAVAALGIPIGVARCVLDPVDQTLPEFVGGAVNDGKGHGFDKAIKYLARRPGEAPKLIRLSRQAKTAGESLSGLLSNLIDCLTAQPVTKG